MTREIHGGEEGGGGDGGGGQVTGPNQSPALLLTATRRHGVVA